jgi:effector-binding domain-containing protein
MTDTYSGTPVDRVEELTVPARTVVGLRERVPLTDLPAFFRRAVPAVAAAFARHGLTAVGPPTAVYRHEIARTFDVTVGFPVEWLPWDVGRLFVEHLPAGRVVQAEHVGPYRTLPATYAALSGWFDAHRRVAPDLMWEEYLVGPGAAEDTGYRTRVRYPVR